MQKKIEEVKKGLLNPRPARESAPKPIPIATDEGLPPNKILFLQSLPESATQELLSAVFQRFTGFVEVRMVPGRPGIAFVEYDNEEQSGVARDSTRGITLEGQQIRVSYAR